jgi:hypothetical protein
MDVGTGGRTALGSSRRTRAVPLKDHLSLYHVLGSRPPSSRTWPSARPD